MSIATVSLCVLLAPGAGAQQIQLPASIGPAGLAVDDQYIGPPPQVEPSPSDVQVKPSEGEGAAPCDGGCDLPGCERCGHDSCCGGCSCYLLGPDEAWELFPKDDCSGIKIGGWVSFGFHDETTPLSTVRGDGLAFNDVPDALNAHQVWFYLEKEAEGDDCCWDWGYRVDIVYGTDAQKTQAFGNPPDAFGNPRRWDNPWITVFTAGPSRKPTCKWPAATCRSSAATSTR